MERIVLVSSPELLHVVRISQDVMHGPEDLPIAAKTWPAPEHWPGGHHRACCADSLDPRSMC